MIKAEAKQVNGLVKPIIGDVDLNNNLGENPDQYRINYSDNIQESPLIVGIQDGELIHRLFTSGNISFTKGKAKTRKSFLQLLIMATILNDSDTYQTFIRPNDIKQGVLWIDTEQAKFDLHKNMKRLSKMLGFESDNLYVFALRPAKTETRLEQIAKQIERFADKISFVLIDGLADLVYDINDRAECVEVITLLMQWSAKYDIHIHTILHENKVGTDARGHAGTELTNKSETVLRVTKDQFDPKRCSTVEGEYTRGMGFDPFTFSITDEGVPMVLNAEFVKSENERVRKLMSKSRSTQPTDYEDKEHMTRLKEWKVFEKEYTRQEIISIIKNIWGIGRDKAGDFLQWYLKEEFFKKTGADRSPKQRYQFIGNNKMYNGWTYEEL